MMFTENRCMSWGDRGAFQAALADTGWEQRKGQENQSQTEAQQGEWSSSLSAGGYRDKSSEGSETGRDTGGGWKEGQ